MAARARSACLVGVDAVGIDVETDIIGKLRRFVVVGLPDGVLREAKDRVRCALENSGFAFPAGEVIVSLAPAALPKHGSGYDLAIALSILAANRYIEAHWLQRYIVHGELALDGKIKPSPGALSIAEYVKRRRVAGLRLMMAEANARTAAQVEGVVPVAVSSLSEAVACISGRTEERIAQPIEPAEEAEDSLDFGDVIGQHAAKRALVVAAAGGHNAVLIGPPGSGKSMLAQRIPGIMPRLSKEESLEVMRIHSLTNNDCGKGTAFNRGLSGIRPFRAPHHTATAAGILGGGTPPRPGEISLAHHGVLFLDEFPEMRRDVLESLREPLESGEIFITRAKYSLRYPAQFVLIAAMNPCPCGRRGLSGSGRSSCRCHVAALQRYRSKVSGPILDRIDIQIWVPAVAVKDLSKRRPGEKTAELRERVLAARSRQQARLGQGASCNARMDTSEVNRCCKLSPAAAVHLETSAEKMELSARAYTRILKVSRTIADIAASEEIAIEHVNEALSYRITLDQLGEDER